MIYNELFTSTIFSSCEAVINSLVVSFCCGRQKSVCTGRVSEGESLQQDAEGLPLVTMSPPPLCYHFPGMGTPHSYHPTKGWGVRRPITPNETGSCL